MSVLVQSERSPAGYWYYEPGYSWLTPYRWEASTVRELPNGQRASVWQEGPEWVAARGVQARGPTPWEALDALVKALGDKT